MKTPALGLLLLTAACDPGAVLSLVGGNGDIASWPVADDSVRATVVAGAFTISLSVLAEFDAPANTMVAVDGTSLVILDVDGVPLKIDYVSASCDDSTATQPLRSRHCIEGRAALQSTDYSRIDSITVKLGYAITRGDSVPLTARFIRDQ